MSTRIYRTALALAAGLGALWLVALAALHASSFESGLVLERHAAKQSGTRALLEPAHRDDGPSGRSVAEARRAANRRPFNLDWRGFLVLREPGEYELRTQAQHGRSRLWIDGELIADSESASVGHITTSNEPVPVRVRYEAGGTHKGWVTAELRTSGDASWERLRADRVSTEPVAPRRVRASAWAAACARVIGALITVALSVAFLAWSRVRLATQPGEPSPMRAAAEPRPRGRRESMAAALFFATLTVLHTWPLATSPGGLALHQNADTKLNTYILAWIAHQLPRDPAGVYDAQIFHPEPRTLTFSEPLLPTGVMAMPLHWMGASPVLVYNALLALGFWLTALAGFWLVRRFTADPLAGLLAGSLVAFNAHSLTRTSHIQIIHAEWIPLALLALDRMLVAGRDTPRRSLTIDALALGACVSLAGLSSGYLGLFTAVTVGVAVLTRADEGWARRRVVIPQLAIGGVLTGAAVLVGLGPYMSAHDDRGLARSLASIAQMSADASAYLSTTGRMHFALWSERVYGIAPDHLFPGVVALALAAAACLSGRGVLREPRLRMLAAIALVGVVLSLGPTTPLYGWLYEHLTPFQGLRKVSRWGYLFLVGVGLLAGVGLAAFRTRLPPRLGMALAMATIAIANLESLKAPVRYLPWEGFSPLYAEIAADPEPGAVLELPLHQGKRYPRNADYVLAATVHFRPLVNGYSGFKPRDFPESATLLNTLPSPEARAEMQRRQVRYLVVHPDEIERTGRDPRALVEALDEEPSFELQSVDASGSRLYRVLKAEPQA